MTELKANLSPYYLEAALATDSGTQNDCYVLDVGRNENGTSVASLRHLNGKVADYVLTVHDLIVPITKLYVIGDWNLSSSAQGYAKLEGGEEGRHEEVRVSKAFK